MRADPGERRARDADRHRRRTISSGSATASTNIAEDIVYLVTGDVEDLNP